MRVRLTDLDQYWRSEPAFGTAALLVVPLVLALAVGASARGRRLAAVLPMIPKPPDAMLVWAAREVPLRLRVFAVRFALAALTAAVAMTFGPGNVRLQPASVPAIPAI